ncbi:hypothetical protein E2I00_017925 [Balaenoptera physalus]|uniref:Uncharacterized protein n=1 Tax=Balaenoptera physalus TaxID=9770 RepID=A0A643BQJ0_BALPH|nr:hypothetical protein E2I00_017925 [Balaenoptera physalus]
MDRMTSSMKQVPNPLPKVLSRRGVGAGMEAAERESFERTQVRTGGPRVAHGWGIPRDAVSWSGLEGSRDLADPGKDRARGPRERASGAQSQSGALPQAYQGTLISLLSFRSGPFPSCLCPQTRLVSPPLPASSGKPSLLDSPGIILTLHVASVPARVGTPALPASVPICNQTPGVSPTQPITSNLQALGK